MGISDTIEYFKERKELKKTIEHKDVHSFAEAVTDLLPIIEKDRDTNYIVLIDIDRTLTEGILAEAIRLPLVGYFVNTQVIVPDINVVALQKLEHLNQGRNALVTNRRDRDSIWASHNILRNVILRLHNWGLTLPIFTNMDRIVSEWLEVQIRDYEGDRFDKMDEWLGDITKNRKPNRIVVISDRGIDTMTENMFVADILERTDNSTGMVYDISSKDHRR